VSARPSVAAAPAGPRGTAIGEIVGGKYKVEQVLGEGGMGVVVSALHLQLGERVALKFLHGAGRGAASERFRREARIAFRLRSEHVARLLDIGTLDDGDPFLVMELLRGETLGARLLRTGPLSLVEACDLALQACEGLAEAHALGIVHRDLKPSNLMITERPDGTPLLKILDFGIAKLLYDRAPPTLADARGAPETHSSSMLGSPSYMSPEQFRNAREVDERTDVWALGIVIHQLLTGDLPFRASNAADTLRAILDQPPRLQLAERGIPQGFSSIVARCLEKARERRFPDVAALAQAIAPYGSPTSQGAPPRIARVLASGANKSSAPPPPAGPAADATEPVDPSALRAAFEPTVAAPPTDQEEIAPTLRAHHAPPVGLRSARPPRSGTARFAIGAIAAGAIAIGAIAIGVSTSGRRSNGHRVRDDDAARGASSSAAAVATSSASAAGAAPKPSASGPSFSFTLTFGSGSANAGTAGAFKNGERVFAPRKPGASFEEATVTERQGDRYQVRFERPPRDSVWLEPGQIRR